MVKPRITKRWQLAPPASANQLTSLGNRQLLAQILFNRGLRTEDDAQQFLHVEDIHRQPEVMLGVPAAVEHIFVALERGERIAVYGDYDADGITATALMMQTLVALGADARAHIPHRVREGYGLNIKSLQRLANEGVSLVITVDCGIRDHEAVQWAQEAGLTVIITDHHTISATLPPAQVVINPKQAACPYPSEDLAGVGVAFVLAYALLREKRRRDGPTNFPGIRLSDLLDLVAIGTVADLMPLNDPINRALVNAGLDVIRAGRRLGLRILMAAADIAPAEMDAGKISYRLAPRINAAGRLADARLAYDLLLCENEGEAFQLADELVALNRRRQTLTTQALETVRERLGDCDLEKSPIICAGDEGFLHGIVGLVAGRLAEEYYRPAVIWEQGEEISHASCRSIPDFNIIEALDACDDLLVRHGGHVSAAGLTVRNENLAALTARLQHLARKTLRGKLLQPVLRLDAELRPEQISLALIDELAQLEPTGYGNPQPLFLVGGLRVKRARAIGKDGAHLSVQFVNPAGGTLRGIAFNMGDLRNTLAPRVDVATFVEGNVWNGRRTIDLNIQDLRPAYPG